MGVFRFVVVFWRKVYFRWYVECHDLYYTTLCYCAYPLGVFDDCKGCVIRNRQFVRVMGYDEYGFYVGKPPRYQRDNIGSGFGVKIVEHLVQTKYIGIEIQILRHHFADGELDDYIYSLLFPSG